MQNTLISAIEQFDPAFFSGDPVDREVFNKNFKQGNKALEPEKRLMLAILEDAIWCLKKSKLKQAAWEWIEAEREEFVFSFENICDELGFNPEYLRKRLRAYVE